MFDLMLLLIGGWFVAMASLRLYRMLADGRLNHYISVLGDSLKTLAAQRRHPRKRSGANRGQVPWGW